MIVAISGFHAGVNANYRKGPKADGIEDIHNFFVALNITAAKQERPTAEQQKKNEHGKKRRQHINRVAEHIWRDISDHQVAEHTSAHSSDDTQYNNPEQIQPLPYRHHGAGGGKGNRTYNFYNKYNIWL